MMQILEQEAPLQIFDRALNTPILVRHRFYCYRLLPTVSLWRSFILYIPQHRPCLEVRIVRFLESFCIRTK